ncbi:MAG: PIN domain-containing protein [Lewinellaceae bacterium]|nr:PIN domain-containing protein [Lewinellaceae bacterium]
MGRREPYFRYAEALFLKAEQNEIELLISAMSYISTEYILRKQLGREKAKQALMGIRTISTVCTSSGKKIDLALVSDIRDFEDAFQYFTALNNSASVIITRNPKDFIDSDLPVMSAEAYVKL